MSDPFDLDPGAWARLRQLLDLALQQPAGVRDAWIDALPPEDATLASRLRNLLAHAPALQGTSIGGGDAVGDLAARLLQTLPKVETGQFAGRPPAPGPAEQVGPYRLLQELGHGGMASVWLAERTDVLQGRRAAIKLPLGAWHGAGLAERLARERAILATLNHPHIATLYDAGVDASGRPWLALEYVQGERIDAHCARLGLGLPARLELFLQVVRAVAHAHGRLVVHRDLKPGNILVTADGQVKLLDFGIAKLLDEDLRADATELTRQAGRALTPDYAAPEQIAGQPLGTACDIYALGVVLYELLAGERPYRLQAGSRTALEQAILAVDPPPPSQRVADASQARALRGDLDTIVRKAMKKSPAERYATAEALAEDIERHLRHEPVLARPDTRLYRVQRFVARHRVAVGAAVAVGVAVLGGAGAAVWQAREARLQRDVALVEKQRAEEVKAFVLGIFRDANPQGGTGRALSAVDLLKLATERVAKIDRSRVDLRVELLGTLGDTLLVLDQTQVAEQVLLQSITEARAGLGDEHRMTTWAKGTLAQVYRRQGRRAEMRAVLEELIPVLRRRQHEQAARFVSVLSDFGNLACEQYRIDECRRAVDEGLDVADRHLGGQHTSVSLLLTKKARLQSMAGDGAGAVASAKRALDLVLALRDNNPAHAMVLNARHGLAAMRAEAGQLAEAVREFDAVLADTVRALGPESSARILRQIEAAPWVAAAGDPARGLAMLDEALSWLQALRPNDLPSRGWALLSRAQVELAKADGHAALKDIQMALELAATFAPPDAPSTLTMRHDLAWALALAGRGDAALAELALAKVPDMAQTPDLASRAALARAEALRLAGRPDEAAAAVDGLVRDVRAAGFALQPIHAAHLASLRLRLGERTARR